jgi:hypothetical protein
MIRQYLHGILAALALVGEYIATRDRMESADPGSDVDQWLRDRAKRDGNL